MLSSMRFCAVLVLEASCALLCPSATGGPSDANHSERYKAGEMHRVARLPSAALRNQGDDTLRITIWYPAMAETERPVSIGPPDSPVFIAGRVAENAPWSDAVARPLILMSHGFGGTARQMTWLGSSLARGGYVVAAVDHPGTNGQDGVTAQGAYAMWERAGDLKAALDLVLADPALAPHIDSARIAVAGFSLGGWTAALIAGARTDFARLDRFCASAQRDSICEPQQEFPLDFSRRHDVLKSPAMRPLAARERARFRDARVRAAFMIAPAMGQATDPASLRAITIPVAVLVGSADPITVPRTNAEVFAKGIHGAQLMVLANVKHYDFLSECAAEGMRMATTYCADGVGTLRSETHATTIDATRRFFDQTLRKHGQRQH